MPTISEGNGHVGDPFNERIATRQDHLDASDELRTSAVMTLERGDLVIASETYWGVVAHMLQAIAERHGLRHRSSWDFREIMKWIRTQTDDLYLSFLFNCSYALHRNFYRIVLTDQEVAANAAYALELADRIRQLAED